MMKLTICSLAFLAVFSAGCGDSGTNQAAERDSTQETQQTTAPQDDLSVPTPDPNALEFVFVPADVKPAFSRLGTIIENPSPSGPEIADAIAQLEVGDQKQWTVKGAFQNRPAEFKISVIRDESTLQISFSTSDDDLRKAIDQGILPNPDESSGL